MRVPRYNIYYPDRQAEKLASLRSSVASAGFMDDGSLIGWSVIQRINGSPKGSSGDKPFIAVQVYESPQGVTPNRARINTLTVMIHCFGEDRAKNFEIARDKVARLEAHIINIHPTLQDWTSLQAADVDAVEGLYTAYYGTGTVVQHPIIETK